MVPYRAWRWRALSANAREGSTEVATQMTIWQEIKRDARWWLATLFLEWSLVISPNDEGKNDLLECLAPWTQRQTARTVAIFFRKRK
jgi:hypothetical protein